jgi:hypothetical protein
MACSEHYGNIMINKKQIGASRTRVAKYGGLGKHTVILQLTWYSRPPFLVT